MLLLVQPQELRKGRGEGAGGQRTQDVFPSRSHSSPGEWGLLFLLRQEETEIFQEEVPSLSCTPNQ